MKVDLISGFLGSGKTTFIRNLIPQLTNREKVAILVNEFGQIGIDGALLREQGGEVVELPGGCICCTLKQDFRSQVKSIAKRYHPDRLIVEPTGIATVSQMVGVLSALEFDNLIERLRVILIVDGSVFNKSLAANRSFFEGQIKAAPTIVVNKCDRIQPLQASMLQQTIAHLNPQAKVLLATFGAVDPEELGIGQRARVLPGEEELSGYESFSTSHTARFSRERLLAFFADLPANRDYGEVERAKGIFHADGQWIRIDLAAGEVGVEPCADAVTSRVTIIGIGLARDLLAATLAACVDAGSQTDP